MDYPKYFPKEFLTFVDLKRLAMPTFTTSIKLLAASDADVAYLNNAMKKKAFHPKDDQGAQKQSPANPIVFTTTKANLLDATADVSTAASSIGKKFSFTIMKDKTRGES